MSTELVTWSAGTGVTLSNGNLTAVLQNMSYTARASVGRDTGKWYWEASISNAGFIGIVDSLASLTSRTYLSSNARYYYSSNGYKYPEIISYGASYNTTTDIIGVALDLDNGTLEFYKNGVSQGISHTDIKSMGMVFPAVNNNGSSTSITTTANFGATEFKYPRPKGFSSYDGSQFDVVNKILISSGDGEYKSVIKGEYTENLIPIMTSNTLPRGEAIFSSEYSTAYEAWKAFNGLPKQTDSWVTTASPTLPQYIGYDFKKPTKVNRYIITSFSDYARNIKSWQFQGYNGVEWENLHSVTGYIFVLGESVTYEIENNIYYEKYRLNITDKQSTTGYFGIGELAMYGKTNNTVKQLSSSSEQNFINHGMDKPLELDMTTVFTRKEIINEDGTSTITDVEPFTLADEFEGKEIKILEYTDNPSQVESKVETEVEPYSIYDEFGDTMEVLYYTDDASKTSASLELTANYSPLDEFYDQPMSLVTYTNDTSPVNVVLEAISPSQWIYQTNDIDIRQGLEGVKLYGSESGKGVSRVILSYDKGVTWYTLKDNVFTKVNPSSVLVDCDLGTYDEYNSQPAFLWESFFQNKETLRIAYFLSEENTEDVAIADKIEIQLAAVSIDTPTIESIQFEISELTLEGRLKDLELINAINMQKLQFKTNALMQSKKYKMHDLVVDTFEEDNMGIIESALTENKEKEFTTPVPMENGFYTEVSLEEFENIKRIEVK